jgi:hypothetical protein
LKIACKFENFDAFYATGAFFEAVDSGQAQFAYSFDGKHGICV